MMNKQTFNNLKLGTKFGSLTAIIVFILISIMSLIISNQVERMLKHQMIEELKDNTIFVHDMIEVFDKSIKQDINHLSLFLKQFLADDFSINTNKQVQIGQHTVPTLLNGTKELNLNFNLIDQFKKSSGAEATIFIKKNDEFIRVTTSLITEQGQRAIGTTLDKASKAYPKLMNKEIYSGMTTLFGKDHMSHYSPILNDKNEVIGALFVSLEINDALKHMSQKISQIQIGAKGYVAVINAKQGKNYGVALVHPKLQGQKILDQFIQNMINQKTGLIEYFYTPQKAQKVAYLSYYEPWDWLIISNTYANDIDEQINNIRLVMLLSALIASALLIVAIQSLFRTFVTRKLHTIGQHVDNIAHGNYTNQIVVESQDELGMLSEQLKQMQFQLNENISSINVVMESTSRGDFSQRVTANAQGELEKLKSNVNQSIDKLDNTMNELTNALRAIQQGNLSHKINMNAQGRFKTALDSADQTIHNMNAMISDINLVMNNIAQGNLKQQVSADTQGDFNTLKSNINQTVIQLQEIIRSLSKIMNAIASGQLNYKIEASQYDGEYQKLTNLTQSSISSLHELVQQILMVAESITSASRQISAGNADLAHRTEEQSAVLQQTTHTLSEFVKQLEINAQQAKTVNQSVIESTKIAEQGGEMILKVMDTIQDITVSSRKVGDIISIIDSIAFQTNILALNAAVEAARAGEQGRGFAVVANEVRTLAQRSANAAKDISILITDTVNKIENGSQQILKTGDTMQNIVSSITKVTHMMNEIAEASHRQTTDIHNVQSSISKIENVSEQNSALVEEVASTSISLSQQAEDLHQAVSHFKL